MIKGSLLGAFFILSQLNEMFWNRTYTLYWIDIDTVLEQDTHLVLDRH